MLAMWASPARSLPSSMCTAVKAGGGGCQQGGRHGLLQPKRGSDVPSFLLDSVPQERAARSSLRARGGDGTGCEYQEAGIARSHLSSCLSHIREAEVVVMTPATRLALMGSFDVPGPGLTLPCASSHLILARLFEPGSFSHLPELL